MYKALLTIHLIAAVIWVGGAFAVNVLVFRMQREKNYPKLLELGSDFSALGMKVFMPASIVVLLAGIGLVIEVDGYDFTDFWVAFGLAGIAFSIVVGAGYLGPEGEKLHALTQSKGPDDPEIQSRLKRVASVSRIELGILLLIVADMAIKPFE